MVAVHATLGSHHSTLPKIVSVILIFSIIAIFQSLVRLRFEPYAVFLKDKVLPAAQNHANSQEYISVASDNNTSNGGRAAILSNGTTTDCIRYATLMPTHNGLGHRFTEVVVGMTFAQEINATYLYNKDGWLLKGKHGSYDWMVDFLPLHDIYATRNDHDHRIQQEQGLQVIEGHYKWMVQHYSNNTCNIEMRTWLHFCCENEKPCFCTTDNNMIGSFDAMKGWFREAFSKSNYSTPTQLSVRLQELGIDTSNVNTTEASHLLVIWHVRVGDLVINNRTEYFSTIATQLSYAFQNSSMTPLIAFLGEGGEDVMMKHFPFLPSICQDFFSNNCFYPNLDVRASLYHMIHSDMLITSGSSFSAIAGILRSTGMTLAAAPKEGKKAAGFYETSEQLRIARNGTIAMIDALKEYVKQQSIQ